MSRLHSYHPALLLAAMAFLVPAAGVPSELVLQDSLKSALVAILTLLACAGLWRRVQRNLARVRWHNVLLLPLVLAAYALASAFWSHAYLAIVECLRWLVLAALMWAVLNAMDGPKRVRWLCMGLHAGASLASFWTVLQFWFDLSWFPQGAAPASSFVNRNFFAEYVVCALPYALWVLANSRHRPAQLGHACLLALQVVALMMAGTRSALLALGVMAPFLAWGFYVCRRAFAWRLWSARERSLVAAVFLVVLTIMACVPSAAGSANPEFAGASALQRAMQRAQSVGDKQQYASGSISVRTGMWMASVRMSLAHPWLGVGAGAWEVAIPLYQRDATMLETDYYAHNEVLQTLAEYGVVVGGLFLAVLLAYLVQAASALRGAARRCVGVRLAALGSLLALLLVSAVGFPWHLAATGMLLAIGLGLLAATDCVLPRQPSLRWAVHRVGPTAAHGAVRMCQVGLGLALLTSAWAFKAEYHLVSALQLGAFLRQTLPAPAPAPMERKAQMLAHLQAGVPLNPHYRKFIAIAAEQLTVEQDWANAIWLQRTVLESRPNIAALWSGLALNLAQSGRAAEAQSAWQKLASLKPNAVQTLNVRVLLHVHADQLDSATTLLQDAMASGQIDPGLLHTAYALAIRTQNQALGVAALQAFQRSWPAHGADTYFRLGMLYFTMAPLSVSKALQAFDQGLRHLAPAQHSAYLAQVPEPLRSDLKRHSQRH